MYIILIPMIIDSLCPPAVLYLGFSIIQILIDLFRGQQNSAFLKIVVMIVFTILLNQLCMGGLTLLSWFIVFIPFIMMTYITTILLYVFGLNPSKGKHPHQQQQPDPRSAHQTAPRPYNSQDVGGCAGTQFGCCPNGVTSSNMYGSNCQWPQPYARHGGHHHYLPSPTATSKPSPRTRATSKPTTTPSPSATSKPSASPSPSPSATSKPSASPSPSPSGPSASPSPSPSASASP